MNKLINKLHKMYYQDIVTLDLLEALEASLSDSEAKVEETDRQRLLDSITWYADFLEFELGLSGVGSIEQRRSEIYAKLLADYKASLEGMKLIADVYTDEHIITYAYKVATVTFTVSRDAIQAGLAKRVYDALRAYIPAHILINQVTYKRKHKELKPFTHAHLKQYTHDLIIYKFRL